MTTEAIDWAGLVGPEPTWQTCRCGATCARVPCWGCTMADERQADARRAEALADITIGKRFAWARLGAPELRKRVRYQGDLETLARRILGAGNVCFVGAPGSGKTSLAVACLRERMPNVMFVSALDLAVARNQHALGKGEATLVERATAARLLLIDDVGQAPVTASCALKAVVFARHDADLPTWTTTGLEGKELSAMYGGGFLRRIAVLNDALVVRLGEKAQP